MSSPRPKARTVMLCPVGSELRAKLVESFMGFSASTVSQIHIDIARECIEHGGPHSDRYFQIKFLDILTANRKPDSKEFEVDFNMMSSAFDLLLKYVINLLKPKRPQVWRSIKTNNAAYKARVACMKGSEDILRRVGYTEKGDNSLQFPETQQEPNRVKLYAIAAELLMAKLEIERMQQDPSLLHGLMEKQHTDSQLEYQPQQQQQQQQLLQHLLLQPQELIAVAPPPGFAPPQGLYALNEVELKKKERKLKKMLRQIELLEDKLKCGEVLDSDQMAKLSRKQDVIDQLEQIKLDQ